MESGPLVQANTPMIREMQPSERDFGKSLVRAFIPNFFLRSRHSASTSAF